MATKIIAWNTGTGNITLTYQGQGGGTITVSSDPNNLGTERSQIINIKTTAGSPVITRELTVSQAACPFPVGDVRNFFYTGSYQEIELPAGQYKLQCWGAQGGSNAAASLYDITAQAGGKGGYSEGVITLSTVTKVRVYVGGAGTSSAGGFNGGGSITGSSTYNASDEEGVSRMGGGGGATDIRLSDGALLSRMIVAGGGSGGACVSRISWQNVNVVKETQSNYGNTYYLFKDIAPIAGDILRIKITSSDATIVQALPVIVKEKLYSNDLNITEGIYVWENTTPANSNFGLTDYIDVSGYDAFKVPYSYNAVASGYDENKNYVYFWSTGTNYPDTPMTFSIPSQVKYIRFNKRLPSGITFYVFLLKNDNIIQLTKNIYNNLIVSNNVENISIQIGKSGSYPTASIDVQKKTDVSNAFQEGYVGGGTNAGGYDSSYYGKQNGAGTNGSFGHGANQDATNYRYCSGAGGGGWYGGGGGRHSNSDMDYCKQSGGGSGFVNTAASAGNRPSGYTGLQLDSGTTYAGNVSFPSTSGGTEMGHSGNGYARITRIS